MTSTIPHLGVYPKELKISTQTSTHACMFTVVLFPIAKKGHSSIPTMDCHSVTKNILIHAIM